MLWQSTIFIVMLVVMMTEAVYYSECSSSQKHNNFVASYTSCSHYIYCDGDRSFLGQCIDGNYFSEEAGRCVEPALSKCKIKTSQDDDSNDNNNNNNENDNNTNDTNNPAFIINYEDISSYISATTTTTTSLLVKTTAKISETSTVATSQAAAPLPKTSISPLHQSSPKESTMAMLEHPQCSSTIDTDYLPHPKLCSAYLICHPDMTILMRCPPEYNFNVLSKKCEREALVNCALNRPARLQCAKGVYDFIPHPDNCEYYYVCTDGYLLIFQCPFGFRWHFERRSCVHESLKKCYTSTRQRIRRRLD